MKETCLIEGATRELMTDRVLQPVLKTCSAQIKPCIPIAVHSECFMWGSTKRGCVVQLFELMKKWGLMYWRSPAYNLTRFLMTTLIALFYGTMYLQKGHLPTSGSPLPSPPCHAACVRC